MHIAIVSLHSNTICTGTYMVHTVYSYMVLIHGTYPINLFCFVVVCSPFSVKPTTASLTPNTCMQVDINFLPQTVGEHSGTLEIHHDTGEGVCSGRFFVGGCN